MTGFRRCTSWLGIDGGRSAVGLHLGVEVLSLVILRDEPLRITAVGRRLVYDVALVGDDARLVEHMGAEIASLAEAVNLPAGSVVVAAAEPSSDRLDVLDALHGLDGGGSERGSIVEVDRRTTDRVVDAVGLAGLELVAVDPVPVALARLARLYRRDVVAMASPCRWTVLAGRGRIEAFRSERAVSSALAVGPDLVSLQAVGALPAVEVPARLGPVVNPTLDAIAVGAAVRCFGYPPWVTAGAGAAAAPSIDAPDPEPAPLTVVRCNAI